MDTCFFDSLDHGVLYIFTGLEPVYARLLWWLQLPDDISSSTVPVGRIRLNVVSVPIMMSSAPIVQRPCCSSF
jgi:hypothetical protein